MINFLLFCQVRNEHDHSTLLALVKRRVDIKDHVEAEYVSLLTPYDCSSVSKQLALSHKVGIILESDTGYQVSTSEGILKVTAENCKCRLRAMTHLHTRHMFAIMKKKRLPLFAPDTVAYRWTLQHMQEVFDNNVNKVNVNSFHE